MTPDVLVVGAGPTGLALACELAWRGVAVRVADRAARPSTRPKAVGVLPRTLELLERHDVVEEMIGCGLRLTRLEVHGGEHGKRTLGHFDFGVLDSAYAHILTLPQAETERILLSRAQDLGVQLAWDTRVTALSPGTDMVSVTMEPTGHRKPPRPSETVDVAWVAGCDGAGSTVRDAIGVPFMGERITQAFNLADADVTDAVAGDRAHLFMSGDGMLFMVPLPDPGGRRFYLVMGEEPGSAAVDRPDPTLDDVRRTVRRRAALTGVTKDEILINPRVLTRFRIQRYLAATFRQGRVLLVGDAAHIHPPSGAQGMNSGIQDAVNLGWKLALVIAGQASEALLDSYDQERRPLARTVQSGAYGILRMATLRSRPLRVLRDLVLSAALATPSIHRGLVEAEAGLAIRYAGQRTPRRFHGLRLRPGDRAPDVRLGSGRLYDALHHPGHTLLVFPGLRPRDQDLARAVHLVERTRQHHPALSAYLVTPGTLVTSTFNTPTLADPHGVVHQRYTAGTQGLSLIRPDRYLALITNNLDTPDLPTWTTSPAKA